MSLFIERTITENQDFFLVNNTSGMLSISPYCTGKFKLQIKMDHLQNNHSQIALIHVEITDVTNSMIENSGSVQFNEITAENFIDFKTGDSLNDRFINVVQYHINNDKTFNNCIFPNIKVEVFSINQNPRNASLLDVRFKATSENKEIGYKFHQHLIHYILLQHKINIENELGIKITAVNINECENHEIQCKSSCQTILIKSNETKLIETQYTNFLGISIIANALCGFQNDSSSFNNHTLENNNIDLGSDCSAFYPPIQPIESFAINFNLIPKSLNGVLLYFGPINNQPNTTVEDFLLLELNNGFPTLLIEFGMNTIDPYETSTDVRNVGSNLYYEIQNTYEDYAGYVAIQDNKQNAAIPKSIADLYSVVCKNKK
ncbi:unnamed protein product [Diamesa serratosioi]